MLQHKLLQVEELMRSLPKEMVLTTPSKMVYSGSDADITNSTATSIMFYKMKLADQIKITEEYQAEIEENKRTFGLFSGELLVLLVPTNYFSVRCTETLRQMEELLDQKTEQAAKLLQENQGLKMQFQMTPTE